MLHKEPVKVKKPTIRQWMTEQELEDDSAFCHIVECIFAPGKFPEYSFVTAYYRYNVKASDISRNELQVIYDSDLALLVWQLNGELQIGLSEECLTNWHLYGAKGKWTGSDKVMHFKPNDDRTYHPNIPPLAITQEDTVTKKAARRK